MPIGTDDGKYFDSEFEYHVSPFKDDSAAGMALEASRKAQDALKRAQGTPPTVDSDTGLEGKVYYRSPYGSITEKDVETGTDLGLAFSGGGLTFAGVKSAGMPAKLSDYAYAQILEKGGVSPRDISTTTGFTKGVEGKWRYEISDRDAVHKPLDTEYYAVSRLHEVLDHPELYTAYPQLRTISVIHDPYYPIKEGAEWDNPLGEYGVASGVIRMGTEAYRDKGTLMHEVQHAIQDIEGFAKGGAPGTMGIDYQLKYAPEIGQAVSEYRDMQDKMLTGHLREMTPEFFKRYDELNKIILKAEEYIKAGKKQAEEYYMRLAGETEARNVQKRLELSPEENRSIPPQETQDYDLNQQISVPRPAMTTSYGVLDPLTGKLKK